MTLSEAITQAAASFRQSGTPRLDAELLLAHLLNKPRTHLFSWPEKKLDAETAEQFEKLAALRSEGHPVAYLLGEQEFWSRPFKVTPDVLIPRPETELLIEIALDHLADKKPTEVADLGTGSGAIAITLAAERRDIEVTAVDISEKALSIARFNASRHRLNNIMFKQGNWLEPLVGSRFDLIVSNPPYVAENDPHLKQGDVRFEPDSALISGKKGLDDIELIATTARNHLKTGGMLLLEHGFDQAENVAMLLERFGYRSVQSYRDLADHPRATCAIWP